LGPFEISKEVIADLPDELLRALLNKLRKPFKAKPRPDLDRKELRPAISRRYSASLAYLGR
jgi:hypothetical protein